MIKKVTIYSAVLAVVFAAVGCFGDSNAVVYNVCTGLCIASLLVFLGCLFRAEFPLVNEPISES